MPALEGVRCDAFPGALQAYVFNVKETLSSLGVTSARSSLLEPVVHTQAAHDAITLAQITRQTQINVKRGGLRWREPDTQLTHG